MEEDINSANIDDCQKNRNKKKPRIRNFFGNVWRRIRMLNDEDNQEESNNDDVLNLGT